jgi:propionate CoA-transferase
LNIAQSARRVVFCCTFRASETEIAIESGALRIHREGRHAKFVKRVQPICFHGPSALARGQRVQFVTERAVFELTPAGLELRELAPGIEAEDILPLMDFVPVIAATQRMPAECFQNF